MEIISKSIEFNPPPPFSHILVNFYPWPYCSSLRQNKHDHNKYGDGPDLWNQLFFGDTRHWLNTIWPRFFFIFGWFFKVRYLKTSSKIWQTIWQKYEEKSWSHISQDNTKPDFKQKNGPSLVITIRKRKYLISFI